jgi:hypothetical protein
VLGLTPSIATAPARMPPAWVPVALARVGRAMLVVLVPLAVASGYRAWVQVWSLDLTVQDARLHPGSVISASALTSGRVHVDLRLELLQDEHAVLLGEARIRTNRNPAMDPRPRRGELAVVVTDEMAQGWREGPARLRVTARGRMQFLREPPPEVRELAVAVAGDSRLPSR